MILRKPYAILIQYFQRIHLLLILCSAYIFYKMLTLRNFVADFLNTESYNAYYEPISDYINPLLIISIIAVIIISVVLIILLRYKKKPWKIYLIPILEYVFMLIVLFYVRSYFVGYNELSTITPIMAGRDLLNIVYLPQYVIFIIFGIRLLGIDLKKFGFKEDEEYLDIKEEDREEFEVNFEFDKDKITRNIKKFIRNVKYVYYEHRLVCNTIIIILCVSITGYTYYYFGILNRTYREGSTFSANYYDITVNSSYLTNRDSRGTVINSKQYYLVLNVTVKNNATKRTINLDRFRVMNKNNEFHYVTREYDNFVDLGRAYNNRDLDTDKQTTFILVYKVPKDLDPNKYVLYYPNIDNDIILRKTKLKVQDVTDIETVKKVKVNEKLEFPTGDNLTITNANLTTSTTYGAYSCAGNSCGPKDLTLSVSNGKILELSFASDSFTGKSFVDFSSIYAKIRYEDTNGKSKQVLTNSLVSGDYFGNYVYFRILDDIAPSSKISLVFTFRNKRYVYDLI